MGSGSLRSPLFVIHGWTAPAPCRIEIDAATVPCDGFFASHAAAADRLWLTLPGDYSGTHGVRVVPAADCP